MAANFKQATGGALGKRIPFADLADADLYVDATLGKAQCSSDGILTAQESALN